MEGLTTETCSLDGPRPANYIQLLSLADGDSLTQPAFGNLTACVLTNGNNGGKPNIIGITAASPNPLPAADVATNSCGTVLLMMPPSCAGAGGSVGTIVTPVLLTSSVVAPSTSSSSSATSAAAAAILDPTTAPTLDSQHAVITSSFNDVVVRSCFVVDSSSIISSVDLPGSATAINGRCPPGASSSAPSSSLAATDAAPLKQTIATLPSMPMLMGPMSASTQLPPASTTTMTDQRPTSRKRSKQPPNRNQAGGWPKGKKRRREHPRLSEPIAPATAYVLYSRERRPLLRIEYPESSNAELTRIIGNEWTRLSKIEKQKYAEKAKHDLERYKRELSEYQRSPEYQEFVREKQRSGGKSGGNFAVDDSVDQQTTMASSSISITANGQGLYCADCDIYFINEHNKSEHLRSHRHLRNTVGQFEKYLSLVSSRRSRSTSYHEETQPPNSKRSIKSSSDRFDPPMDMEESIAQVFLNNQERRIELSNLKSYAEAMKSKTSAKKLELEKLAARHETMTRGIMKIKLQRVISIQQLTNLRAIPTLFETEDYLA